MLGYVERMCKCCRAYLLPYYGVCLRCATEGKKEKQKKAMEKLRQEQVIHTRTNFNTRKL